MTEIGRLTLQGSSEVYSLGQLALAWLERPEGHRNLEVVANALQAICGAAQRMEELAMLAPGVQLGQLRHVIQQMAQRLDVAVQHAQEFLARLRRRMLHAQAMRHIGHHADVAAQVMRDLLPQLRALQVQRAQVMQRRFQVPDMALGLLLLQAEILGAAVLHIARVGGGPGLARNAHGAMRIGMLLGIGLQLRHHDFVEQAQLAHDFMQVIALLPAVQAVGGGLLAIDRAP